MSDDPTPDKAESYRFASMHPDPKDRDLHLYTWLVYEIEDAEERLEEIPLDESAWDYQKGRLDALRTVHMPLAKRLLAAGWMDDALKQYKDGEDEQ